MAIDPRDFLLNTDYELDKIILVKTGDYTGSKDVSHGLNFTPLVFGVWSTDSNFTSCNALGSFSASGEPGYTAPLGVECTADNSKVSLKSSGSGANSTRIYYRIYGFAPNGANLEAPATSNLAEKFILNTDYNYRKLKATGEFTQSGQSYAHNLGYIPQVMAWFEYNGTRPSSFISLANDFYITVTENNISCTLPVVPPISKITWRIYYDEA